MNAFEETTRANIPPETLKKAEQHAAICKTLNDIFVAKNADYGDSFSSLYKKLGLIRAVTRISDKTNRLQSLCTREELVKDESVRDTLLDLANYAIMTIIEMDNLKS